MTTAAATARVPVPAPQEYSSQSSTDARKAAKAVAAPMTLRRSSRQAARKTLRRSPRLAKKS